MSGSGTGTPSASPVAAQRSGMTLGDMIVETRLVLKDIGLKSIADRSLIGSANEAKDAIVQIMRQAREDYFLASTSSTVIPATPPSGSIITLPTDFITLKNVYCNSLGYEGIAFVPMDQSSPEFRRALVDGGSYSSGNSVAYYDLYGTSKVIFAPGFDLTLSITIDYIKSVADMMEMIDEPVDIPAEFRHYIVTSMICDALRMSGNKALEAWQTSVDEKKEFLIQNIQPRQIKDPVFVRGFMEGEW